MNYLSRSYLAAGAGCLLALSAMTASAVGEGEYSQINCPLPAFSEVDTDGDGRISREEASAHPDVASIFDTADQDGDGHLSQSEYERTARMVCP